ncbi:MAG: hypothetical protein ACTSQF_02115 [Candidatus Heimdallarchaeaceae archaeon]
MSDSSDDFPLYMSSVTVNEGKQVELIVVYEGYGEGIDKVLLIGQKNNLPTDITKAMVFEKGEKVSRASFEITFPIWEDGSFQAVVEKGGKYAYEPGEAHNLVFRGRGVFLDLRKIYHLSKDIAPPKEAKETKKGKKSKKEDVPQEQLPAQEPIEAVAAPAYDDFNMLSLKPRDFRIFNPALKGYLLQLLDYLNNPKSLQLVFDTVILPDIARSLKVCISEEGRLSVFDVCFPPIVLIEKALIFSGMIHNQILDEESVNRYKREVVNKLPEIRTLIQQAEFRVTTDLIKKEYDDDIHEFKSKFFDEI